MPLNFPTSPVLNQLYTFNGKTWKWDGAGWRSYNVAIPAAQGPTGPTGPAGAITTDYVISINGATGAITDVAKTNVTNTFSSKQVFSGGLSASTGICGGSYVYSESGYRIGSSSLNTRSGTTYTLLSSDDGKIVTSNNAATQVITIPTGLPVGFNCSVMQLGTGSVALTGGFSATLASYGNKFNIAGQYAVATIISPSSDVYVIAGGLTA